MCAYLKSEEVYLDRLGSNIRKRRNELSISQEELAIRAGLDRTYIVSVERGERNISVLNLRKIAKALECDEAHFFKQANKCER